MTNQFFGFSPEAFEQFVRAVALSVFGPGVTAFGNGPDGGREATFRGEVPYPYPPATQWSGYGVIQAKCKEKTESTDKDQKWALKLLDEELKTFVKSRKRKPKPEYYVFVTNVELSSTAEGGRDKADKLILSYYHRLPLKGHAIWDANQLNVFLTKYEELCRRFTAYITPGDVLGEMLKDIERRKPNASRILTAFLERELRADEASRLDQAGNRTEEQLRLAHLFFDLPASTEPQLAPPDEKSDNAGLLPRGVLWELLRDGSRKLDPKTLYEQEISSTEYKSERFPTGYVLLGGPGSGKSTVGQFLAQIHRSALLEKRKQHLLGPQTRQIIQETRELCNNEGLPWPTTPRYPFRVELNRFAKALASKESDRVESLECYLLNLLKREHSMTNDDLLEWLAIYPWLLILDGLDEVPSTSNRDVLVKAVNDFIAEARQVEADIFVVATSRQQGYGGEFASEFVAFRHILPLSKVRALRYVERFANARFGLADPTRARDVVDKLRESAKRQLTAQLISSPLQVTFMVTVVAARGDPGEDRWQLIDSYYRTIYDRERQKAVPPYDAVLSKQQPTIDRLHHDIGFWLQYRGEMAEGPSVSLPINQFERLVDTYLHEIGREGSEKDQMVRLITDAARHRLVFLTSRVAGELSFEVRSLQEYMAAECLMTGDPEIVKDRLKAIAPAPYWRNVFLFAASKCFVDARSRHLQDTIRLICEDLNTSNDALLDITKAGSELAIDVLQSGAVAENPNHARHLARIGFGLLSQPYLISEFKEGASAAQRLAIVYSGALKTVYLQELGLRIGHVDLYRTIGAWTLLVRLIDNCLDWANELGNKLWPAETKAQMTLISNMPATVVRVPWIWNKFLEIAKMIYYMPPMETMKIIRIFLNMRSGIVDKIDPLVSLLTVLSATSYRVHISLNISHVTRDAFGIIFNPAFLGDNKYTAWFQDMSRIPPGHPGWLPFIKASNFITSPNAKTLANVLMECANGGWIPSDKTYLNRLPWPLANCLLTVRSLEELHNLAKQVAKGELGDSSDWKSLEERWRSEGIFLDVLVQRSNEALALDGSRWILGLPVIGSWSIKVQKYPKSELQSIFKTAQCMQDCAVRHKVVQFLLEACSYSGGIAKCIKPSEFRDLWEATCDKLEWQENYVGYPDKLELVAPWLDFFDFLGCSDSLSHDYHITEDTREYDNAWCSTFQNAFIIGLSQNGLLRLSNHNSERSRLGLLRLLGRLASIGYSIDKIPAEMLNVDYFFEPRFKLAAILVRLSQPTFTEEDAVRLADESVALLYPPAEPGADHLIFRTVRAHLGRIPVIERFLLRLHEKMPPEVELGVAKCERLMRQVLQRRASDLQQVDQLRNLKLPEVHPA